MSFKIYINKEIVATAPNERGAYNTALRIENGEAYHRITQNDKVCFGENLDSTVTTTEYRVLHEQEFYSDVEYD